jgi:hypothetical protein
VSSGIEYAAAGIRGAVPSALESCAKWAGVGLETVVEAYRAGRWGEFIESRQLTRPMSGDKALRIIEEKRHDPSNKPLSHAAAKVILRHYISKWDREAAQEERRRLNPNACLAELNAKRQEWD